MWSLGLLFCFVETRSCCGSIGFSGTCLAFRIIFCLRHFVGQAGLNSLYSPCWSLKFVAIFLPQPSKCWDYRNIRLGLVYKLALNLWSSWPPNAETTDLYYHIPVILSGRLHINTLGHFSVIRVQTWLWNQRKNERELVLFFQHECPRAQTEAVKHGKCLYHWAPH